MKKIQIAPSILAADFGRLNEEIASVEPYVDMLHVDVMDGHFVPNITIGSPVIHCLKTGLPIDCHLMIDYPERYIENFVKAGAWSITVHQEACKHLHRVLQQIKSYKIRAAVSVNPATPLTMIEEVLDIADMVLVMSVNPGFGGQNFIHKALEKIQALRMLAPDLDIQVDGGINRETAEKCRNAGANILVAGSYIFGTKDRKKAIQALKEA